VDQVAVTVQEPLAVQVFTLASLDKDTPVEMLIVLVALLVAEGMQVLGKMVFLRSLVLVVEPSRIRFQDKSVAVAVAVADMLVAAYQQGMVGALVVETAAHSSMAMGQTPQNRAAAVAVPLAVAVE